MTTVSVVIPALNDAEMLKACLAALAAQTRPADEIVVVDNGSTDDTAAVARAAGAKVVFEPIPGIWPASAAGYDASTGEIIARLDADSVPPSDWILRIIARFNASPALAALTGPGDYYGGNAFVRTLGQYLYMSGYFWFVGWWLGNAPLFGSNMAMRREAWLIVRPEVNRGLKNVHDDLDLSMHLAPELEIGLDKTLRVGISARPFKNWRGFFHRLGLAWTTFRLNWPEATPWRRRAAKRRWLRGQSVPAQAEGQPES